MYAAECVFNHESDEFRCIEEACKRVFSVIGKYTTKITKNVRSWHT